MEFPAAARYIQRKKADLGDSDEFRMYHCKILPCRKRYSHDWSDCVFAHAGEKVQRRCPRKHKYIGFMCPDMRKDGVCPRGENCCFAHNSFEYWLHPSRYRTELCTFGTACKRPVCFFAHAPCELRIPNSAGVATTGYMAEAMMPDMMHMPPVYQNAGLPLSLEMQTQSLHAQGMLDYSYNTSSSQFGSAAALQLPTSMPFSGMPAANPAFNELPMQYSDTQADVPHVPFMESPSSSSQESTQFNMYEQQAMPQMSAPRHTPTLSSPDVLLYNGPANGPAMRTMRPMEGAPLPQGNRILMMKQNDSSAANCTAADYTARGAAVSTGFVYQQAGQQWPLMY